MDIHNKCNDAPNVDNAENINAQNPSNLNNQIGYERSINAVLSHCGNIYSDILNSYAFGSAFQIDEKLKIIEQEYNSMKNALENIAKYIIRSKSIINNKKAYMKNNKSAISLHNMFDVLEYDQASIKSSYYNVADKVSIPAVKVNTIDDIPNTDIYWVESLDQFAFKLNNIVFRGNIGNIYTNRDHHNNRVGIFKCPKGTKCQDMYNKIGCKYYHDPVTMTSLRHMNSNTNIKYQKIKNWNNSAWIYTADNITSNNLYLRHIGNRDTLYSDIIHVKESIKCGEMIENAKMQLMHDILVNIATKYTI